MYLKGSNLRPLGSVWDSESIKERKIKIRCKLNKLILYNLFKLILFDSLII